MYKQITLTKACNFCENKKYMVRPVDSAGNYSVQCCKCGRTGIYPWEFIEGFITAPKPIKCKELEEFRGEGGVISYEDIALMRWDLAKKGRVKLNARKLK